MPSMRIVGFAIGSHAELQLGGQSSLALVGNELSCGVVVDDQLAVVRVGGAYACNLQHRITAGNMNARVGRPRTK
jgi:hypothetical protein